ncbi:unnamed protein product [Euphydryas editha]|uniref:Uncharacterized protein n=1 Tax=Euphydryas editha TaxID=104508 RepID=A0AAU9TLN1_EUPED|nr:unnamed protein product [Euphydryas editha]
MDAPHFEEWFTKVLTKLQRNDVTVLDNASYHSRRLEKTPTFAWNKDAIQNWLRAKNILFDDDEVKRQLMEKVSNVKENFKSIFIDQIAEHKDLKKLLDDAIAQVTKEKWAKCVEHVKILETEMKGLDHQIDQTVDKFIIRVSDSSSYSSESESEGDN